MTPVKDLVRLFQTLKILTILNSIIGIGLEFTSLYKLSEIFCFYTFVNYYGIKYFNQYS